MSTSTVGSPQAAASRIIVAVVSSARLAAGQQHLPDPHAQVEHLLHVRVRGHVRADRPHQVDGRRAAVQQLVGLAAQCVADAAGERPAALMAGLARRG